MEQKLTNLLTESIEILYEKDQHLIDLGGMEQACVARIIIYMSELIKVADSRFSELQEYDLDCEYNKHVKGAKKILSDNGSEILIRPDLVLHKRGDDHSNLMAVEFKMWSNTKNSNDRKKLESLTKSAGYGGYGYEIGFSVKIGKECPHTSIYKNGEHIDPITLSRGGEAQTRDLTDQNCAI